MGNKNLEYVINEVSEYLIERGHAPSREALKFEWNNSLSNLVGIRNGVITLPSEHKIKIKIEKGIVPHKYSLSLKGEFLDEKSDRISLEISKGSKGIRRKETRSENLKQLYKVIPEARLYPISDFFCGLYKGLSDTAVLFFLFKNLEGKNLAALASVTDYGVINFGEWFGEKRGAKNMREYQSKNVPKFHVSAIFEGHKKKFAESRPWLARKQLEEYILNKYCDKNRAKFNDMYLCRVEEINKILENPTKRWKEELVDILAEGKIDGKRMVEMIQFDDKTEKFVMPQQNKEQLEKIIMDEIAKGNAEEFEKYKDKLKVFYNRLDKTRGEIKVERIYRSIFPDKNLRDKKLFLLISALPQINTAEIAEQLKKLNKELTEKKLRTERGRFSDFTRNFCGVVERGYYNEGRSIEYLDDVGDILSSMKSKKELSKRDIKTLNEFISDYVYTQRLFLEDSKTIPEEQKKSIETKISEAGKFVSDYNKFLEESKSSGEEQKRAVETKTEAPSQSTPDSTKNSGDNLAAGIADFEDYLINSKRLIRELDGYNERRYMTLEELEDWANETVQSITRPLNEKELETITENSFQFLNRNKKLELASFGSLIGMGILSEYVGGNKWGWGAAIGAKSFLDGFLIGENNRMTETYFLYQYRKHLENSNVDPDLAYSEFNSISMRCYSTGSAIGMGAGLFFAYAISDRYPLFMFIPISVAALCAAAAGSVHYLFQKKSRERFKPPAPSSKQIPMQETQIDAKQLKDATALKTEKNEVSA